MGGLRSIGYSHVQEMLTNLLQWVGYDDPSWEPAKSVYGLHAINPYYEYYSYKLGPLLEYDLKGL
jgi:hypothetical protein